MTTKNNIEKSQTREEIMQELRHSLRPGQQKLADWTGGDLAISAVPGSGKSHSLAVAAALLIAREQLYQKRQVVICTLTRSAAANIKVKIKDFLGQLKLPKNRGFVVYTIHGLALNIANKHREFSGLNLETSTLVIPTPSHRLMRNTVEKWINLNPGLYGKLLEGKEIDGEETEKLRRKLALRTDILPKLAHAIIKEAKSSGIKPEKLFEIAQSSDDHYEILRISAGLYQEYQKLLKLNNLLDYDDMISGALKVLKNDNISKMWQKQVYAVFEDEAQDSTFLQNQLLHKLATNPDNENERNLVRVGDPNQAINSTFTPADPKYFRSFCEKCDLENRLAKMQEAGRSTPIIIKAANFILSWCNEYVKKNYKQPEYNVQNDVFYVQDIKPVSEDDPQKNPEQIDKGVEIYEPKGIYETVNLIKERVIKLFRENPESNAAILVRENRQVQFLAYELQNDLQNKHHIKVFTVSENEGNSEIPEEMFRILQFLDRPHSVEYLKNALQIMLNRKVILAQDIDALATIPEMFLYPGLLNEEQHDNIKQASHFCRSLLSAKLELSSYHLIRFIALSLKYDNSELATAEKLAENVARQNFIKSSLKSTIEALKEIIKNKKFEPVNVDENDDKYTAKGQLTIMTMHKSKGLDWDYVFIPFLTKDIIPGESYVPQGGEFLGDFTLAEVSRVQMRASLDNKNKNLPLPNALQSWEKAEYLKTAEEFRLIYVAMTRAKKLLWISGEKTGPFKWNLFEPKNGTNCRDNKAPSPIINALIKEGFGSDRF